MGVGGCFFGLSATSWCDFIIIWIGIKRVATIARFHTIKRDTVGVWCILAIPCSRSNVWCTTRSKHPPRVFFVEMSDHWFNPDIDVRKSGEWGSWRGGGVGKSPHPPIIFYLLSSKHRFSNLSLGTNPSLPPTSHLSHYFLYAAVAFWQSRFLKVNHFDSTFPPPPWGPCEWM